MEHITSRKNRIIAHFKSLSSDSAYRRENSEFVCDGEKTLKEALAFNAEITAVIWANEPTVSLDESVKQYSCPMELLQYASPLKNSNGPLFAVKMKRSTQNAEKHSHVMVLENLQDPGNVGTVIRTANAMGIDSVVLTGDCADLYNPKTVRATMGAIFRQSVFEMTLDEMGDYLRQNDLALYGAALSDKALDIRDVMMKSVAVAIGSEGRGLSQELLALCDGQLIIPMRPDCESLNAAVAASIVMWEMAR